MPILREGDKNAKGAGAHETMVHGHGITPEAHAKALERRRRRELRLNDSEPNLADIAVAASLKRAMGEPLDALEDSLIFDD